MLVRGEDAAVMLIKHATKERAEMMKQVKKLTDEKQTSIEMAKGIHCKNRSRKGKEGNHEDVIQHMRY